MTAVEVRDDIVIHDMGYHMEELIGSDPLERYLVLAINVDLILSEGGKNGVERSPGNSSLMFGS